MWSYDWEHSMEFVSVWLMGYVNPARMIENLRYKPAPLWGVYGQLARTVLDALLLYVPLALMGRSPSTPSCLTFLPTEGYYAASILLAPLVLMAQWLLLGAILHVILRFLGRESDIDQILNITGMSALVVGAFLVVWDWLWIGLGWANPTWLGISHLVVDIWGIVITVIGFRRLLGMPTGPAIALNLVWMILGLPIAIVFVRAPV
jgi:hypothetical protein